MSEPCYHILHNNCLFLSLIFLFIRALRDAGVCCPISVDTRNSEVARQAVLAGADLVNDVSGKNRKN